MLKLRVKKEEHRAQQTTSSEDLSKMGLRNSFTPTAIDRIKLDAKDLNALNENGLMIHESNEMNPVKFRITPLSGYWEGQNFEFEMVYPPDYPFKAPKVTLHTKIFHPNFDKDGNVCLNILRESWSPMLTSSDVIIGVQTLFCDFGTENPLNEEAAKLYETDREKFISIAKSKNS